MQIKIDGILKDIEGIKKQIGLQDLNSLEEVNETVRKMQNDFENLKLKFQNFATSERMEKFERRLREFITYDAFKEYQSTMRMYATQDDIKRTLAHIEKLDSKFELYMSKYDFDEHQAFQNK
jgi:hypothetical protein